MLTGFPNSASYSLLVRPKITRAGPTTDSLANEALIVSLPCPWWYTCCGQTDNRLTPAAMILLREILRIVPRKRLSGRCNAAETHLRCLIIAAICFCLHLGWSSHAPTLATFTSQPSPRISGSEPIHCEALLPDPLAWRGEPVSRARRRQRVPARQPRRLATPDLWCSLRRAVSSSNG